MVSACLEPAAVTFLHLDENGKLTLGSLFSGSGAFELGGMLAGIRPVFASEVEPFPIRVTTKRLPFVKHYGDVNEGVQYNAVAHARILDGICN